MVEILAEEAVMFAPDRREKSKKKSIPELKTTKPGDESNLRDTTLHDPYVMKELFDLICKIVGP